jgi:ATP-binding cassette subfamily B protein
MRRINRILEERPEIQDHPRVLSRFSIRGDIRFHGLTFRYPGQSVDAVQDIRLEIREGQTIAVVGRVGSGKTTLLQAIPRIHVIPEGSLFIDGTDVLQIPLKALRSRIGFVPQESTIFSDTIRNNVLFGTTDVSDADLEEALKAACIHDEIMDLEMGWDTILGERGLTLSGGQRQRLTIARALVIDPRILIFDDALSMVDTNTEEGILNTVLQKRAGKTSIITSHRVSTIRRADLIVVMDRGKIVETGDHHTLMKKGSLYTDLYRRQTLAQALEKEE